jgi:hypothetical protein
MGMRATVTDALSPIREAVYSVDAGEWKPAQAADGLLDGERETLLIDPLAPITAGGADAGGADAGDGGNRPAGERREAHMVLLRVTDAAYNVVTFDLSHDRPQSVPASR